MGDLKESAKKTTILLFVKFDSRLDGINKVMKVGCFCLFLSLRSFFFLLGVESAKSAFY